MCHIIIFISPFVMCGSFQAESQAVRNVVLANRHRLVSYLSYHSFGQKIMYPWSYSEEKVQSKEQSKDNSTQFVT